LKRANLSKDRDAKPTSLRWRHYDGRVAKSKSCKIILILKVTLVLIALFGIPRQSFNFS